MNLRKTRLRGRPRNRWKDEVREDGRIFGGEVWQEEVHNREEWKKLLRSARNHRIMHMPMKWNTNASVPAVTTTTTMMMMMMTVSRTSDFNLKKQVC